jgi:hypothetical protein
VTGPATATPPKRLTGPIIASSIVAAPCLICEHFVANGPSMAALIDLHDARPGDPVLDVAFWTCTTPGLAIRSWTWPSGPARARAHLTGPRRLRPDATEQATNAELLPFYRFLRGIAAVKWLDQMRQRAPDRPTASTASASLRSGSRN